jgi:hypothetical protein
MSSSTFPASSLSPPTPYLYLPFPQSRTYVTMLVAASDYRRPGYVSVVDASEYERFERQQKDRLARHRRRAFSPANEVPGVIVVGTIIGRDELVAVVLIEVHVYSVGPEFLTSARSHPDYEVAFLPTMPAVAERFGRPLASLPDVSVSYPGGARIGAQSPREVFELAEADESTPILCESGVSGGEGKLDRRYWLSPLPTGDVDFIFAWPEHGLPELRTPIAASEVAHARTLNQTLWPSTPPARS